MGAAVPFAGTSRFEIERALGAGGMGVVYLAWDRERKMRVALKTLAEADPGNLARLKNEFRALADIAHPNLVGLYELFAEAGHWFFTMEAVDGVRFDAFCARAPKLGEADLLITTRVKAKGRTRDLRALAKPELAREDEPLEPAANDARAPRPVADLEKLRVALRGLVDGVEALHAAGKLHCDLKPSNVLVAADGRVAVLDFGLVKERPRDPEELSISLEGTPEYVAPEVVRGLVPVIASDWYSVGVMLFHAITGQAPFSGLHYTATLLAKLDRDAPRVSSLVDGVPADLDDLVASLLVRDPAERAGAGAIRRWLDGSSAPADADRSAPEEPPFVGRSGELEALERAFELAARGEPRFVFVRGPSGIGKSALVRAFGGRLERAGRALVLASRCYEREQVPFKALDGIVDALASHLARLPDVRASELVPEGAASLAVLFPVLRAVDVIARMPEPEGQDPGETRAIAAEAARTIMRRLGEQLPIVIAIDDLQWGDADSAALVSQIVDPRSTSRALLVASVRSSTDEPEVLRAFRGAASERVIDLDVGPLAAEDSIALARSLIRGEGGEERARSIVADAAGHPFFVAELARHAGKGATSVDEVVAARVDALAGEPRALLEVAAIAGVPVGPAALARAAGLAGDPLPALRLLGARSLLKSGARGRVEVEPYHDRIREVVAGRIEEGRRKGLHAALGSALEEEAEADPETIADHLARGGERARALPHQVRAAERASRALAFDRAVSLWEQAVALAGEAERDRLRVGYADALVLAGRSRDAAPIFLECARALPAGPERARLERRAAEEWLKCGRIDDGIAVLRGVLGEVGLRYPDSQGEALARALVRILRIRRLDGKFTEVGEDRVPPEKLARVDVGKAAGTGLMLVDPLRGYGFLARFLLDAIAAGEPRRVSAGLSLNAVTLCRGGEAGYPRAKQWLEVARTIGDRFEDDYLRGLADACEAGASVCTGRWRAGATFGLGAPAKLRASGTPATWECTAAVSLARSSLLFLGELASLREHTARHLRAAEDVGDLFAATYARVHGWFAAAMDGEIARGRAELDEALAKWSRLGFHAMHFWRLYGELQYDLYEGDAMRGLDRLAKHRADLKKSRILAMQFYRAFLTASEASLVLARAEESRSERADRLAAAKKLASALMNEKRPYSDALGSMTYARMARLRGKERDAIADLDRAIEGFAVSEMSLHRAAAEALRGKIVRGDDGRAAIARAEESVRAQGVRDPARWLAMLGAT